MKMNKIKTAICKHCLKEFKTTTLIQKFCSVECRYNRSQQKRRKQHKAKVHEQPCWTCTKACGECSWSRTLKPIDGWKAEKVPFKTGLADKSSDFTYKIIECPEYEKEIRK